MKIGARLAIGYGAVLVLLALLVAVALGALGNMRDSIIETVERRFPTTEQANELSTAMALELQAPAPPQADRQRRIGERSRQGLLAVRQLIGTAEAAGDDAAAHCNRQIDRLLAAHERFRAMLDQGARDPARALYLSDWLVLQQSAIDAADELVRLEGRRLTDSALDTRALHERERSVLIALAALAAGLAAVLGTALTRSIARPIRRAVATAQRVAGGEPPSGRPRGSDETAQLLDAMEQLEGRLSRNSARRTAAEAALRDSERRYRLLAENATDIICSHDGDFRYRYVSPSCEAVLGWTQQELIGADPIMLCHDADRPAFSAAVARLLQARFGEPHALTFRARHRDGRLLWIETVGRHVREGIDDGAGLVTVMRDVTARRLAEQRIRESQAVLARSQAQARIGSWWYDFGTEELRWSEETYRIFGVDAAVQPTLPMFLTLVHPDDRDRLLEHWIAAMADGPAYDAEHRSDVGGRTKWIRERAEIDRDGDGRPLLATGTAQDITQIKEKEQALLQHREQLRELADHREQVREEERRRIAREVHDELGQYLTALRLDTAMLGLRFGSLAPELKSQVETMKQTIDQTMSVVREITAALRPGILDEGLGAAAEWLLSRFSERHDLAARLILPSCELALDDTVATAAFRILQESLTNVARHAQAACVEIRIAVDSTQLRLRVADDGIGFDPQQVAGRRTFGLLGIRERVAALGGELSIDARPGAGTTLSVSLPLSR